MEKNSLRDDESAIMADDAEPMLASEDCFRSHFLFNIEEGLVSQQGEQAESRTVVIPSPTVGHVVFHGKSDVDCAAAALAPPPTLLNIGAMKQLRENWTSVQPETSRGTFTPLQEELMKHIRQYKDLVYSEASLDRCDEIRKLYCLHAVNHCMKTRNIVLKNTARIAVATEKGNMDAVMDIQDQGFTRPRVLILLPFRNSCLKAVDTIIKLLHRENLHVMNKKRFYSEYGIDRETEKNQSRFIQRSADFKTMFEGNIDDGFKIGLKVTKKAVKLFVELYSADIIIASPLGLRTAIGAEGDKMRDFDFLTSIEVLVLDQADVFLMQNWEHVLDVLQHTNLLPTDPRGTDFSRVRLWALNGLYKMYRQTLVFSAVQAPPINGLFSKFCNNYAGKVRCRPASYLGTLGDVEVSIPQTFQRFESSSFMEDSEKRLSFFIHSILSEVKRNGVGNVAVYIPSYFDYVRVRNRLKKEDLHFGIITEYSKRSTVMKTRAQFLSGSCKLLLITERFYFFYRYRIKGIRHLIFYGPPTYPSFYRELVNSVDGETMDSGDRRDVPTSTVIYSRFDALTLEQVVGTAHVATMLKSDKDVHLIVTG